MEDTNDNDPEFDQAAYSFDNIRETIGMDEVIGSGNILTSSFSLERLLPVVSSLHKKKMSCKLLFL